MKYQCIIMGGDTPETKDVLRQFYVPVKEQDGRWLPCGAMVEEKVPQMDIFVTATEYLDADESECGPLADIPPLPGFKVEARLWLPDNYVPESPEVREEGERRAKDYLREMLGDG